MDKYYVGIDVGGTNIVAGVVNQDGLILARAKCKAKDSADAQQLCDSFVKVAREAVEAAGIDENDICSVGLGIPGAIDRENGIILKTVNMPFFKTPIREMFQKQWNIPVYLGNDANCFAVGEYLCGASKGKHSSIVVTLGTGIGGGVIIDGKIFMGCNQTGMEIGHMSIIQDGKMCNCGRRGCWETYASATGLKAITQEMLDLYPDSAMHKMVAENGKISGKTPFEAARLEDTAGIKTVELYLRYLSTGITNIINIFQPDVIVLAGGVSNEKDDLFIEPLNRYIQQERITKAGIQTEIVKSTLGGDAGIIGAAFIERASC